MPRMCLQMNAVQPWQKWHWAGDEIHDTIVPAARRVPGGGRFDIDVREYLSVDQDAVVEREIHRFLAKQPDAVVRRFATRAPGNFDFRARCVREWLGEIVYARKGRAAKDWLFPAETLGHGRGDCEDLALLAAAYLHAAGISDYCVRVALGYLIEHTPGKKKPVKHDHAWTMYFDESGAWQIIEPLTLKPRHGKLKKAPRALATNGTEVEYVPYVVFNRSHLWRVRSPHAEDYDDLGEYLEERSAFWPRFDPTFATGVHNSIYDEALGRHLDSNNLQAIKDASLAADVNVLAYDPRDHFDFGYIDAGWEKAQGRLKVPDITAFAYAAHATADFYAHTLWGTPMVNTPVNGKIPIYDAARPRDFKDLNWDFSKWGGEPGSDVPEAGAEAKWQGQLISGQWWRWYTRYPSELKDPSELEKRRCLPDHDCLSCDSGTREGSHKLFTDMNDYTKWFNLRVDAATRHVEQLFLEWHGEHGDDALWKP
jgi:hypothetical protein